MCGIAGWIAKPGAPPRRNGDGGHAGCDGAPRPGRPGRRAFRDAATGRAWCSATGAWRSSTPTARRQPMCDDAARARAHLQRRDLQLPRAARRARRRAATASRATPTPRCCCAPTSTGARTWCEHLRGMFAFAIWDARARSASSWRATASARSRCSCAEDADGLYFASEIKALLQLPRLAARRSTWRRCGTTSRIATCRARGRCSAASASSLPGTCATWERGRLTERRYWMRARPRAAQAPRDASRTATRSPSSSSTSTRRCKLQMVSDVPFGAFLSGGLDSSTIVGADDAPQRAGEDLLGRLQRRAATASSAYAGVVARHFGTDHHELVVDSNDLIEHLPRLVGYRDAPVTEPSDIPIYMLAQRGLAEREDGAHRRGQRRDARRLSQARRTSASRGGYQRRCRAFVRHELIEPLAHVAAVRLPPRQDRDRPTSTSRTGRERYARWFGALERRRARRALGAARRTADGARRRAAVRRRPAATRRCAASSTSTRPAGCRTTCWSAATA